MKEKIREEAIPFDQDTGSESEPDGCNHRSGGEEFLHERVLMWK